MAAGNFISRKPRTGTAVELKRLQISHGALRVQYDLDINAPSQHFIYDCCLGGVYEAPTTNFLPQVRPRRNRELRRASG